MAAALTQGKWRYSRIIYAALLGVAILQAVLTYFICTREWLSGVSFSKLILIRFSILIPEVLIWFIAARGARRFKNYAVNIAGSPDGRALNDIANGLLVLVVYIITLGVMANLINLLKASDLRDEAITSFNYLPLFIVALASFWLYRGTQQLMLLTGKPFWTGKRMMSMLIPFSIFAVVFGANFYMHAPSLMTVSGDPRFVLPLPMLMMTYVLPHVVVWTLGIISGANLAWYAKHVSGNLYKQIFKQAYIGVILVYMCIFLAQILMSSPIVESTFNLGVLFIYAVIILNIVGFTYVYRGADKLQKIEDLA